jgi:ABC-type nitrate/sulfonate/bicarbonate transport system ATPase subunit
MQPKLTVSNVSLSWDGQPIVQDVSFELPAGSIMCLVGRSGTGKTTIFHALAGLARPDAGEILLDGQDIAGQPGRISYMQQKDLLLEHKTIVDNVSLPLVLRKVPKKEARAQAAARFPQFGLEGTEKLYPHQLSGGMRQRAALLRTYMMHNDVVLMDEPFSALDAITRQDLRGWMAGMLTELGLTAILITHDVDDAMALADSIAVIAGAPSKGVPSRLVGRIAIDAPRADRASFMLSEESLAIKKQVLELLETPL